MEWQNVGTARERKSNVFASDDLYTIWHNGEGFNVTKDGNPPSEGTSTYRLESILKLKNLEAVTYKGIH